MNDTPTWDALYGQAMEDAPKLAKPPLAPALGSVVKLGKESMSEDCTKEIDRLKAENARLAAENFSLKGQLGKIRSGTGRVMKFLRAELATLRKENSRLRAVVERKG